MDKSLNSCAKVFPDLDALSRAAAEESARAAAEAVAARGQCAIALAGGRTPARTYALWATEYRDRLPWKQIHVFWGDERFVPAHDPKSNYRMVRETLLEKVPLPSGNVHAIGTAFVQSEEAARVYEKTLREFFPADGPSFDVVFLGVGVEGHTASLFPDSPALAEHRRWVVDVRAPVEPPVRISLTLPILRRARETYFLVAGADKHEIVGFLRKDPRAAAQKLPAAMVQPEGKVIWFLDQAANG